MDFTTENALTNTRRKFDIHRNSATPLDVSVMSSQAELQILIVAAATLAKIPITKDATTSQFQIWFSSLKSSDKIALTGKLEVLRTKLADWTNNPLAQQTGFSAFPNFILYAICVAYNKDATSGASFTMGAGSGAGASTISVSGNSSSAAAGTVKHTTQPSSLNPIDIQGRLPDTYIEFLTAHSMSTPPNPVQGVQISLALIKAIKEDCIINLNSLKVNFDQYLIALAGKPINVLFMQKQSGLRPLIIVAAISKKIEIPDDVLNEQVFNHWSSTKFTSTIKAPIQAELEDMRTRFENWKKTGLDDGSENRAFPNNILYQIAMTSQRIKIPHTTTSSLIRPPLPLPPTLTPTPIASPPTRPTRIPEAKSVLVQIDREIKNCSINFFTHHIPSPPTKKERSEIINELLSSIDEEIQRTITPTIQKLGYTNWNHFIETLSNEILPVSMTYTDFEKFCESPRISGNFHKFYQTLGSGALAGTKKVRFRHGTNTALHKIDKVEFARDGLSQYKFLVGEGLYTASCDLAFNYLTGHKGSSLVSTTGQASAGVIGIDVENIKPGATVRFTRHGGPERVTEVMVLIGDLYETIFNQMKLLSTQGPIIKRIAETENISNTNIYNLALKHQLTRAEPTLIGIAFENFQYGIASGGYEPCFLHYTTTTENDPLGSTYAKLTIASRAHFASAAQIQAAVAAGAVRGDVMRNASSIYGI